MLNHFYPSFSQLELIWLDQLPVKQMCECLQELEMHDKNKECILEHERRAAQS